MAERNAAPAKSAPAHEGPPASASSLPEPPAARSRKPAQPAAPPTGEFTEPQTFGSASTAN